MMSYRFYAELPQGRGKGAKGDAPAFTRANLAQGLIRCSVLAIPLESGKPMWQGASLNMDSVSVAIEGNPYSYSINSLSRYYLRKRCTRISESLARQLSPSLFAYLGV